LGWCHRLCRVALSVDPGATRAGARTALKVFSHFSSEVPDSLHIRSYPCIFHYPQPFPRRSEKCCKRACSSDFAPSHPGGRRFESMQSRCIDADCLDAGDRRRQAGGEVNARSTSEASRWRKGAQRPHPHCARRLPSGDGKLAVWVRHAGAFMSAPQTATLGRRGAPARSWSRRFAAGRVPASPRLRFDTVSRRWP
jgi:hypothetical protein